MLEHHHPRLALACSFQKEEAVLIDMLLTLEPTARVFTIDTGVLFPETYRTWRELERRYGVRVEIFDARARRRPSRGTPSSAARRARSRRSTSRSTASTAGSPACAASRRRPARSAPKLGFDARRGIWKANPIADWDAEGACGITSPATTSPTTRCTTAATSRSAAMPCTLPGSGREGRWAGSDKTECGIHV